MQKVQIPTGKRPAAKPSDATNKSWSITNSSDTDLLVISTSSENNQPEFQFYEGSLEVLKTVEGNEVITKGKTGTIAVGTNANSIIIARADNLFPVKTIVCDSETGAFPSLSVTTADADSMKLAQKFQQAVIAIPGAALAVDFSTALQSKDPAQVDAFFRSSSNYQSLTLDHVVAVQTYYAVYPFVWTYYQKEKVYYLYSSDGKVNKYLGQLFLGNNCSVPVNPDKSLLGFTITYKKDGGSSQSLFYLNGQFVNDTKSKSPDICLQGLFTLKSMLSADDQDNAIVCALTGTVDGAAVLGYSDEVKPDSDKPQQDGGSTPDTLVHPETTKDLVKFFGSLVGAALGFVILCKGVMALVQWKTNLSPDEIQKMQEKMRRETQATLDKINTRMKLGGDDALKIPEDVTASLDPIKRQANELLMKDSKMKMLDIVNRQDKIVDYIEPLVNSDALQTVTDTIWEVKLKADTMNLSEFNNALPDFLTKTTKASNVLEIQVKKLGNSLETETINAIDRAKTSIDRATTEVKTIEKFRDDLVEDKVIEDRLTDLFDDF